MAVPLGNESNRAKKHKESNESDQEEDSCRGWIHELSKRLRDNVSTEMSALQFPSISPVRSWSIPAVRLDLSDPTFAGRLLLDNRRAR